MDLRALLDLFKTISFSELRVRVIETVLMIFRSNFSEVFGFRSEVLHVV